MRLAAEVASRLATSADLDVVPESEVFVGGRSTGHLVTGAILEAAVAWGDLFVLFLTDDVPFEDSLHVHLFSPERGCLDTLTLGHAYTTGAFRSLELQPRGQLSFRFFGELDWSLEVLSARGFRLPWISDPRGVSRRFGFTRRLRIHARPSAPDGEQPVEEPA